jgi:hypothetical protein
VQTRAHAEAALSNLANSLLHGSELRIGWGKAVALPPQPIYPPPRHVVALREQAVAAVRSRGRGDHGWGRGEDAEAALHRVRDGSAQTCLPASHLLWFA